ncbi:MAG: Maf family protein [Mariprofundaceae bacterium]|nr:Maf family protein [Mariprofundaceae bacterium]
MADSGVLLLASTSPYRRALLARLGLVFEVCAPDFEEMQPGAIPARDLVRHNTLGKARSAAHSRPDATVIASDQLAVCAGAVLGKPGNHQAAAEQLAFLSGKAVDFLTGLALIAGGEERYDCIRFRVFFRELGEDEIEAYLHADQPYDCAGSFKSEALGIALFERMQGDDPTALMGLPLITLSSWLKPLRPR